MTTPSRSKKFALTHPLEDNDLSDLTKREILFWSRKLRLTPSELFTLSVEELEQQLAKAQMEENESTERTERFQRCRDMIETKQKILDDQQKRLKAGGRSVWEILAEAAQEIEESYNLRLQQQQQQPHPQTMPSQQTAANLTSSFRPQQNGFSTPYASPQSASSMERQPGYWATPPCGYTQPSLTPNSRSMALPNTTYDSGGSSGRARSRNPTYNASGVPQSTPYGMRSPPANICQDFAMQPQQRAQYNIPQSQAHRMPDNDFECANNSGLAFHPSAAMASTPQTNAQSRSPYFRNYTDYSMEFSLDTIDERTQSITVEEVNGQASKVSAQSRILSVPHPMPGNTTYNIQSDRPFTPQAFRGGSPQTSQAYGMARSPTPGYPPSIEAFVPAASSTLIEPSDELHETQHRPVTTPTQRKLLQCDCPCLQQAYDNTTLGPSVSSQNGKM